MSYFVKDYMIQEVNIIDYEATVTDAAKVMATDKNYEGYVIVLKKGKPIGIITERDMVNKVLAEELVPSKIGISTIMSAPLITFDPEDDLLQAPKLMQKHNVRKLVVIKNNIIYGVISAKCIAQRCGDYVDKSIKDIIRWTGPLGI